MQLPIAINFISSKDVDEEIAMQSKSDNKEFMIYDGANNIVDEIFESLHSRYQSDLETSTKGSDFIFDSVQLLYYKCYKTNLTRGGSYIESPDRIKNKKVTINPKNKNDKCFQYATTVALIYEEIRWSPERVSNIKPYTNKYILH